MNHKSTSKNAEVSVRTVLLENWKHGLPVIDYFDHRLTTTLRRLFPAACYRTRAADFIVCLCLATAFLALKSWQFPGRRVMFKKNGDKWLYQTVERNLGGQERSTHQYSSFKGIVMKNSECTIYIMFKDRCVNRFRREKEGWFLTTSNGTVRPCTAEQLISHLLPALAGIRGKHVTVRVEPDKRIEI